MVGSFSFFSLSSLSISICITLHLIWIKHIWYGLYRMDRIILQARLEARYLIEEHGHHVPRSEILHSHTQQHHQVRKSMRINVSVLFPSSGLLIIQTDRSGFSCCETTNQTTWITLQSPPLLLTDFVLLVVTVGQHLQHHEGETGGREELQYSK